MRLLTVLSICLLQVIRFAYASDFNWTKPNGLSPSFTDTYTRGERIILSWLSLNNSINDLWLTRYNASVDSFSLRLELAQNISIAGSFDWTIAVDPDEIAKDTRFILQFLPAGQAYNPTAVPQLPSPPFNLITVNQQALPNGTIGAPSLLSATSTSIGSLQASETASVTLTSQPSSTSSPASTGSPPISGVAKAAIAVAAAVVGVAATVGTLYAIGKYRRRAKRPVSTEEKAEGPYEVLGTSKQPIELNSKETMLHELNSSKETMVYESDSSVIHEIATTTKRPGLHELPG